MNRPRLKKALGQHHLVDPGICRPLAAFLDPAGRLLLEVGPGGGALTGLLLEAGARVWACELDPEWAFELSRRLVDERLEVMVANSLDLDWRRLPEGLLVAGNLPFNVGTVVIERLLLAARGVERAGFLVQREVAERLVAGPGDSPYGSLSVLTAARADASLLGRVPARLFRPPPRVDGAFVGLRMRAPAVAWDELPAFARTVRAAFALRRKTLRNSLAASWGRERADRAIADLDLHLLTRAESLPLAAFVDLHRWFRISRHL